MKTKNTKYLVAYLVVSLLIAPSITQAHRGRLDSHGCHHNRKVGNYECHKGKFRGRTFASKSEMLSGRGENESKAGQKTFSGRVISVTDGDTIKVMRDGKPVKIRLAGIDCPEKKQAYGMFAKEFAAGLVMDETVRIKSTGKDRYGRIIGEVFLPDGRSLNRQLVKVGLAWWYQKYSDDESLGSLEREAKRRGIGLWQGRNPVPPWEFRRKNRRGR